MSSAMSEMKLHSTGKVREIYHADDDLIMVASDRISAYDVVLPDPIPDKGKVLTGMAKRMAPDANCMATASVADLEAVAAALKA